nr:uncharacterized protein LOC124818762 [Hydra vulgaris]XP_047145802.1 uncharacterized protein LOC124818762 [Hydra vulgaris]
MTYNSLLDAIQTYEEEMITKYRVTKESKDFSSFMTFMTYNSLLDAIQTYEEEMITKYRVTKESKDFSKDDNSSNDCDFRNLTFIRTSNFKKKHLYIGQWI